MFIPIIIPGVKRRSDYDVHSALEDHRKENGALLAEVFSGEADKVVALLEAGESPDRVAVVTIAAVGQLSGDRTEFHLGGRTALCQAALKDYYGVVQVLVAFGACLTLSGPAGETPLHCAQDEGVGACSAKLGRAGTRTQSFRLPPLGTCDGPAPLGAEPLVSAPSQTHSYRVASR